MTAGDPQVPGPPPVGGSRRRIRLLLEYDGTAFRGWQSQVGVPTVQDALERALGALCRHPVRVHGAGRTDAGVHAEGQVAHFDTDAALPLTRIRSGLNGLLPRAAACVEADEAPADFDARGWSVGKVYRYRIANRPARAALDAGRSWHVPQALDLDTMDRALRPLLGTHDFSAFRAADCQATNPVKELRRIVIARGPAGVVDIEVEGSGFLKQMVRNLVGTAVEVGAGKRPEGDPERLLRERDRRASGPTAPARGLTLVRVLYPPEGSRPEPGVPPSHGVHHVALKANDVEGMAAFWSRVLGLKQAARHLRVDGSLRSVWLAAGGSVLMIEGAAPGPSTGLPPFDADRPGLHLLALSISARDRAGWRAWLEGQGVRLAAETPSTLYLLDPEGNRIGLSCWPSRPDG